MLGPRTYIEFFNDSEYSTHLMEIVLHIHQNALQSELIRKVITALPKKEYDKMNRFYFRKDQERSCIGKLLLLLLLKENNIPCSLKR